MTSQAKTDSPTVHRTTQIGTVTSAKMQKTITVKVERLVRHPKYGKFIKRFSVLKAHDPLGSAKLGDKVEVEFTRPLSKTKRWRLLRVLVSTAHEANAS